LRQAEAGKLRKLEREGEFREEIVLFPVIFLFEFQMSADHGFSLAYYTSNFQIWIELQVTAEFMLH